MSPPDEPEATLVRFLLGDLGEAERAGIEERLFGDAELRDALDSATDGLIEDFLAGSLSPADRQRFETRFLASQRHRQRLRFMKTMVAALGSAGLVRGPTRRAGPRSYIPWIAAAGIALAVAGTVALFLFRDDGARQASANPSPSPSHGPYGGPSIAAVSPTPGPQPPRVPVSSPARPPEPTVHTVRLAVAEGTATEVPLRPGTLTVRLEAAVPPGAAAYVATVRSASGDEVWRMEGTEPLAKGRPLRIDVPTDVLPEGDYVLSIEREAIRGIPAASRLVLERRLRITRPSR